MTERITGIVDRLSDAEDYNSISWILEDPVENIALSAVDDTIKTNADFQYQAGLESSVTRYTEPSGNWPCDWCQGLEGTYSIDDYPSELFMHHEKCRCVIEWDNKQTGTHDVLRAVDTEPYWKKIDPAEIEGRKNFVGVATEPKTTLSQNGEMVGQLESLNVKNNPVVELQEKLSSDEIILKVGGGDKTEGSCVSTAHAYIGNRAGYDVRDFRDGESRFFFADRSNTRKICDFDGVVFFAEKNTDDYKAISAMVKKAEEEREYLLVSGKHGAIVKKSDGVWRYLELQSETENGWHNLNNRALKERFNCRHSHSWLGMKQEPESLLIDTETLYKNEAYKELLGYINTAESAQMKGAGGGIK